MSAKGKEPGVLRGALVLAALLALNGCYYRDTQGFETLMPQDVRETPHKTLNVHYLGTGGIFLQGEGVSLLGDPFVTNPFPWHAVSPFGKGSDTQRIDGILDALPGLSPLQAILVTHSHYDHAMDVPYITGRHAPACVYGSETLGNLLGNEARKRFCSLAAYVNRTDGDAHWVQLAPRVRFAAIEAEHFEHLRFWFFSWFYADGEQDTPLEEPPSQLYGWRVGTTYSFLIDILDDSAPDEVLFRILYMPSAATHPKGTPGAKLLEGRKIDLAILGAAQLEMDRTYPGALLEALHPRAVMLVHWESFFDDYRAPRLLNFRVSPSELRRRIRAVDENVKVYWPYRGAHVNVALTAE